MLKRSSHPLLSYTDGIATGMGDICLLIGRVLIALVFLMTVSTGGPAAAYLKSLNYPAPEFMSVLAHVVGPSRPAAPPRPCFISDIKKPSASRRSS